MIKLERVVKRFRSPDGESLTVLDGVDFELRGPGRSLAIVGPSGSGKSTLLALVAGLDRPSDGRVLVDDADIGAMSEGALARFRARKLGFVFQSFQLLEQFSALQNVCIAAEIAQVPNALHVARAALDRVGLSARQQHRPTQLSGGECQRVAIARAIVGRPKLLLCDEPTGSLDPANAERILALLTEVQQELGATLVLVTHDAKIAASLDECLTLERGRIASVTTRAAA